MPVFAVLAVIFLLAFLVESLTEYIFGRVIEHVPVLQPYSWLLVYVAAGVGVLGAFVYNFDLLVLLGQLVGIEVPQTPFGLVLSGLAIGRGANYIHEIVSKYFKKPEN